MRGRALPFVALLACNEISGAADLAIQEADAGRSVDAGQTTKPDAGSGAAPGTGSATERVSVITPDGLDFGDLACGAHVPAPRHVEIESRADVEIGYHAELTGKAFTVTPADGFIPSGGKVSVIISSQGASADGPAGEQTELLTITTNALADTPHPFDVRLNVIGATLVVSPSGSLDYGTVSSSASKQVSIRNDGNLPGTLTFKFTTNSYNTFSIEPSTPAVVMPGSVEVRTVTAKPPTSGATNKNGTLTFSTTSQLCGPVPSALSLTARR